MNTENINKWLTLAANIGVIVGILLLAIELNQNNELLESEARYNLQLSRADELRQFAENVDLRTVWFKAGENIELTDDEQRQLLAMLLQRFVQWEWYYEQYTKGLIQFENVPINAWKEIMRDSIARREIWNNSRNIFSSDFVKFMDENIL